MYAILIYDIGEKRVGKMLKLCRRYLTWIQNSVFEGHITEGKMKQLVLECKELMNEEEDSLIIFTGRDDRGLEKKIYGVEKNSTDNFL